MDIQHIAQDISVQGDHELGDIGFISNKEQYLIFLLNEEKYAINILSVEEIRNWEQPTKIPNSPSYVKGVINMRGIIVPILDLRLKFAINEGLYNENTVVIILTIEVDDKSRTIGFIVDAVSDVLDVDENDIKSDSILGGCIPKEYIKGLVNVDEDVVTLLRVEELYTIESHNHTPS